MTEVAVSIEESPSKGLDEWSFAIDNSTGNVYFYNRRTRETRWSLPGNEANSSGSLISSLSTAHNVLKRVEAEEIEKQQQNELKGKNGKENSKVREAIDPATGTKYYYDPVTRVSSWEDPRTNNLAVGSNIDIRSNDHSDMNGDIARPKLQKITPVDRANHQMTTVNEENHKVTSVLKHKKRQEEEALAAKLNNGSDDWTERSSDTKSFAMDAPKSVEHSPPLKRRIESSNPVSVNPTTLSSTWSSLGGTQSKRTSASSNSSSQERATTAVVVHQDEFNEDDLRLLKERLRMMKLRSPQRSRPGKPHSETIKSAMRGSGSNPTVPVEVRVAGVPPSSSSTVCLRMSGCKCPACTTGTGPSVLASELVPCESCGRKFDPKSIAKHSKVCNKVFSKKDSSMMEETKSATPKVSHGMPKWRKQSQELRLAMQRGRGAEVTIIEADETEGLITCPHCERKFSEKAAERHIPKCVDIQAKPKTLRKGEGKAVHTALHSPALGTSSPAKTPGRALATERKSLAERNQATQPCPHCRRQFAVRSLERHVETCSSRRTNSSRLSVGVNNGKGRQQILSPSSRSSSSWDGAHFE